LNATFNATWIKSDSLTRKHKGLEKVDLDFLCQPWGLLVSVCTGVAQRVALREVIAEVMSPIVDAWLDKPAGWDTLLSTDGGLLEALKKPTFRDWVKRLDPDAQHALNSFVNQILRKICWTGINATGKLVVACPQFGDSGSCIHLPLKTSRALTWILKDTERSATFACLTNTCFVDHPRVGECQDILSPQWQDHVPAVITSGCQKDLQNEGVYWMGTSEDKRRVTIETQAAGPARLTISNHMTHWSFFRRAWERIERMRQTPHIELRERRLMIEDHKQDVVIVRDLDT
jgi:hypothetical protein